MANFSLKVYYEDTDAEGIVYYANYLKYFERARTELIYSCGLNHKDILSKYEIRIVVKSCDVEFKKPAKFEDNLNVFTKIIKISPVRITMEQKILRKEDVLVDGKIDLVTIDNKGLPKKMPDELYNKFKNSIS